MTDERVEYYRNPAVRARIIEFLGGDGTGVPTCCYLATGDEEHALFAEHQTHEALDSLFENGLEIYRSLWDGNSLLADFDIEYVNFDHPEEAFLDPERIFDLQQPLVEAIERALPEYGISALHVLSGRGHHFIWRIPRDSKAFQELAGIGRGPESLWKTEKERHPPEGRTVPERLARAFAGLGMIMEFLAHRIRQAAAPKTSIPMEFTAVEVGPSEHGREMISIDISEYGDPLHSRVVRVPFSIYLKPWQQRWAIDSGVLDNLSPLVVVPVQTASWREAHAIAHDFGAAAELAGQIRVPIPPATDGMEKLIAHYRGSDLARAHAWFYSQEPHGPGEWKETYDGFPLEILPACVRVALEKPNDLLLRPAFIRLLVRIMLALGWHPRHISGLIHSKYARPFGWTQFAGVDPATRADFYTRIFTGLFVTGRDDLVDFNCVSAQEQNICAFTNCGVDLLKFKQSALDRRAHDQLACRPFNRLFLPPKHS